MMLLKLNLALFVVISDERVFSGSVRESSDRYESWKAQLASIRAYDPVVIGSAAGGQSRVHAGDSSASEAGSKYPQAVAVTDFDPEIDTIGVVSIQDGPTIESGGIIAPEVKASDGAKDHNYFQDPEAFLALGGRRGKQLQVLTDGAFFINRWFGAVE
jgi:hypothetical protein